jgi:HK97 family phage major capsid protein
MERGLFNAVEDQVLNGDGTGENMTGILQTSGIVVQAWNSGGLLPTLRKASTALELNGEVPNAWAMHPSDVEALDLLEDNEARMYFAGPQRQIATTNPVWSLPVVKSVAVTPGTAILADWTAVRLVVRQDATLNIDASGALFERNQFKARLEGRFGVAVLRPGAFGQVDLTA